MDWTGILPIAMTWAGIAALGRRKGWSATVRHGGGFVLGLFALVLTISIMDALRSEARHDTNTPLPPAVTAPEPSLSTVHTPADYRGLASLTSAAVMRSMQLFSKLGDSDTFIYHREIYSPVSTLLDQWPVYYAPEAKDVPEALMDCREAASNWILYLGRATHKNPQELVLRSAEKDLAKTKEKLRLCDDALAS